MKKNPIRQKREKMPYYNNKATLAVYLVLFACIMLFVRCHIL